MEIEMNQFILRCNGTKEAERDSFVTYSSSVQSGKKKKMRVIKQWKLLRLGSRCVYVHTNSRLATITALFFKERDNICQQIDLWLCPWTDLHTASTARETTYQWYNQGINQTIRTAFIPSVQSSGQQINTKTRQSTNQTK